MSAIADKFTPAVATPAVDSLFIAHVFFMRRLFEGSAAAQGDGDADPPARPVKVEPCCRQYQRSAGLEQVLGGILLCNGIIGGGGLSRERKKLNRCLQNKQ